MLNLFQCITKKFRNKFWMTAAYCFFLFYSYAQGVDTFRVVKQAEAQKKFEPLVAQFSHKTGGKITAAEASVGCCIILNRDDVQVASFTISISEKREWFGYEMLGNQLSAEAINKLRGLKTGDKFSIEKIVAYGNDGLRCSVSPLSFKIE